LARGISLHIGVNSLNALEYPLQTYDHYRYSVFAHDGNNRLEVAGDRCVVGWKGPLGGPKKGCEKDAIDMAEIAATQGFDVTVLATEDATVARVEQEIRNAARALKAGDIFLVSYAGHGSQVVDLTNDEADNEDETWCLYDRMFLDDEQRALYTEFAERVRILVFSDSCHSGTATRSGGTVSASGDSALGETSVRAMPRETAKAVYKARRDDYDRIQRNLENPPAKLRASRILISACQDSEEAMGNDENGFFTRAVKSVWDSGRFKGNYQDFAKKIRAELLEDYVGAVKRNDGDSSNVKKQVPNFVAVSDKELVSHLDEFVDQRPFSIESP